MKTMIIALIEDSYGCDNCIHQYGPIGMGAYEHCSPDSIPPPNHIPDRGTIQEKT